jgi:GNAT superfamily N-acetyltransferase
MKVFVKRADEQDFPKILDLIKEFSVFQGAREKVTVTLEQMIKERGFFQCFIAENENREVLGYVTFFFAYYSWTGKAVYLDDLYVREVFRKQGIGKQLLQSVIDFAKEEQCRKVRWQVSKWNANAIAFYKSMGAQIDEVEINCDLVLNA